MKFAFYLNENINIHVHYEMVNFFGNHIHHIESFHKTNYYVVHINELHQMTRIERSTFLKKIKENYKESGIVISKEISGYFL
jgi:dihydroxyacetone kinase